MHFDSKSSWFKEKSLFLKGFVTKKKRQEEKNAPRIT